MNFVLINLVKAVGEDESRTLLDLAYANNLIIVDENEKNYRFFRVQVARTNLKSVQTDSFAYQWIIISKDGGCCEDIKYKIAKAEYWKLHWWQWSSVVLKLRPSERQRRIYWIFSRKNVSRLFRVFIWPTTFQIVTCTKTGLGGCRKEKFKGKLNIVGGCKEGNFKKNGWRSNARSCVGFRRLGPGISFSKTRFLCF